MRFLGVLLSVVCLLSSACTQSAPDPKADNGGKAGSGGSGPNVDRDAGAQPEKDASGSAAGDCKVGSSRECGKTKTETGACSFGKQKCGEDGSWGECEGSVVPTDETCDGVDNDCDGTTDEELITTFYRDTDGDGFGGSEKQDACDDPDGKKNEWIEASGDCDDDEALVAPGKTELCDGLDNDCKNGVDDGMNLTAEICDGLDNDCANGIDDGLPTLAAANVQGACSTNVQVCDAGSYQDSEDNHVPSAEICDGIDNDCANGVDDGLLTIPAATVQGPCSANVRFCNGANGYVNSPNNYVLTVEVCDGIDNDCANGIDDGLGEIASVNTQGACASNKKFCYGANGYVDKPSNHEPSAEICDGVDNNCANGVDEGMGPIAAANVQGACSGNVRICSGVNGYVNKSSNYVPTAETCDAIDNDCANGVDDGLGTLPAANVQGACSANTRSCNGVNGFVSSPSNYMPITEVCDGIDNDCTGGVDNGLGPIAAVNAAGACAGNRQVCLGVSGYVNSPSNYVPATEVCDGIDNDCANGIDNGLPELPADNLNGACSGNKKVCLGVNGYVNKLSNYAALASDTTCNAIDEDCSGVADEEYVPNTSCFLPGVCAANNVASSCSPVMETPCDSTPSGFAADQCGGLDDNCDGIVDCGCVPTAANDTTCNGIDDDCDDGVDEDYVAVTSCFKQGVCAAGNQASSCNFGQLTACKTGSPTSATDATCDGIDGDCSGTADEDWVADSACFKQGVCASGNVASKCIAGAFTACKTNAPTTTEDLCAGADDNCDGTADTVCYNKLTNDEQKTCGGCYKDMFAGKYVYCDGTYPKATKTGCDWSGNNCTFASDKSVTAAECKQLCRNEPGCYFATSYYDSICNLHLMTECSQNSSGASGTIYQKQVSCLPTAQNDVTCDGKDDDCSGTADEDWAPDTSCYKSGLCASGNAASTCTNGVATACRTGTPAPQDLCAGQDNNCDGTVATVCFTQLTSSQQQTCKGCYKDMFAGRYVYCDGTYPGATKSGCDWVGGSGTCTFPANKSITAVQCQTMCEQEPGCYFFTSYSNSICNLHLMTSCTLQSAGASGDVFKKNVACIPSAQTDATCDGVDDDCSGAADEDWVTDSSCFKQGVCASGNAASKCQSGVLTACKTGSQTSTFDTCNGLDGNCDGSVETSCWTEVSHNTTSTCGGCYKDLYAGQYVYCDGTYEGATKDDCEWIGGAGCTFTRQTSVTAKQCQDLCEDEPGCSYVTSYYDSICNLHLMTSCSQTTSGAPGSIYASPDACVPVYSDDSSCDGKDDDCDGAVDEDYVRKTTCFKSGACAPGNVASSCAAGVETACKTGSPAAANDLCAGQDDNCDGAVDTVCFTQLTTNMTKTCSGCRKDMTTGAYVNCNGGVTGATKSNCPSASGGTGCTFTADASVTQQECLDLCESETGCYFATNYGNATCNLHLMTTCTQVTAGSPGNIFRVDGCISTSSSDTTCNGVDEDCSGVADEDYAAKTSCYRPGVCAAGNVASKCSLGVETACKTGTPGASDLCTGKDDNCDGTITTCNDTDGDGISDPNDSCGGDNASGNTDSDSICNDLDNCPNNANSTQTDTDRDGIGDVCDKCPSKASTDQFDADNDGVGNVCDPDYQLPSPPPPSGGHNGGNPARPTCGFTPQCPGTPNVSKYAQYLFGCYPEEPNGGDLCLGDRWWYHLNRRIYPMMVGTQTSGVEGILEELEKPKYNTPSQACGSGLPACPSEAPCTDGVCLYPAMKNYIDRLSYSSDFLSCTGTSSYENTWPASRVIKLDSGPCGWESFGWKSSYGYRIVNTMGEPMTVWVGRGAGSATGDADKRWWTLWPNEEIRFNSHDVAYVFPTGASAYNACQPSAMSRQVHTENLTPPNFTQINAVPLVTYTSVYGGTLTIYRDRYLKTDFDLFAYPNYFGVGLGPKGTNGTKPLHGFQAVAIPPSLGARYPELSCR